MTRKKFCCMFGAGFLLAIAMFTGLFLLVLQSDPSALPPEAASSSGPTAFQAISGGDLYMLLGLVVFLLLFFYFVFKG